MAKSLEEAMIAALQKEGYDFSPSQQKQFLDYLGILDRWNQRINLTAIRDPFDMISLHLLDSLSISPYIKGESIIDIGTGAGLPGIPLAIAFPEKTFVLLDSNSKKTRFLVQATAELGIKNIQIVHARCEDFQSAPGFDHIVSRAFSRIALMLSATQHLLAKGGEFLAMKGAYPASELMDLPPEFAMDVHPLIIKGLAAERHLVCIRKR